MKFIDEVEISVAAGDGGVMMIAQGVTSLVRHTSNIDDAFRALRVVLQAQASFDDGRRLPV